MSSDSVLTAEYGDGALFERRLFHALFGTS